MGLLEIIDVVKAALQFPDAMRRLIRVLRSTDAKDHDALVKQSEADAEARRQGGRPRYDA